MILRSREKIMIFLAVLAVVFWGYDRFYYMPQKKKFMEYKAEMAATDSKIEQAMALRQGVETIEKEISHLEKELQVYHKRLIQGEEIRAFLNQLAKDCARLKIKVVSLSPQEEKESEGKEQKEKAAKYKKVMVRMAMYATYKSLENFINNIEHLPFLISLEQVKIERKEEKFPYLLISLEMGVRVYEKENKDNS